MGMGAVNVGEQLLASVGKAGPVAPLFAAAADIPDAGVLLAVPALVACGLLRDTPKLFGLPRGCGGRGAGWMQDDPDSAGIFYVDEHVRVYNGAQTALPRHYVSRQRLCLR